MRRLQKKIVGAGFFILFFVFGSAAFAENEDSWKFIVAPYLWALNMNGRVQTGPATLHVNETFSDILNQFQGGGMLLVDAQKENWGVFVNAIYAVLSQNITNIPEPVSSHTHFGIFSAGLSYTILNKTLCNQVSKLALDPYIGARYTLNNTTLKVSNLSFSNNQHWTDPIVGLRLRYTINSQWLSILAGDVGGTNLNNHNSYNVQGFVGYRPTSIKHTTVYAGYRVLYQKYLTGSNSKRFNWNMRLFGPVVGLAFDF